MSLDTIGNVVTDATSATTTRAYSGQKLTSETVSGTTTKSFYDSQGNLDCTTASAYTGTACPAAGNTHLKVDYLYDYRNRLVGTRAYSAGTLTASTDIAIDALDRPVSQTSGGATTTFAYTGTSNRVATETKGSAVKSYGYGAYGERLTITDGANRYSYLYNQHGDVSLLVDQANTVKQAYGYTAYGGVDTTITKSAASFTDPNPYRYSAKRWDSATGTYDMGARRYSPATTRWLQADMYVGSVDNLGLSQDPLLANRYQFTGGNPINYLEVDGHLLVGAGEGARAVGIVGLSGTAFWCLLWCKKTISAYASWVDSRDNVFVAANPKASDGKPPKNETASQKAERETADAIDERMGKNYTKKNVKVNPGMAGETEIDVIGGKIAVEVTLGKRKGLGDIAKKRRVLGKDTEVVIYAPNIDGKSKKYLERNGVKVFTDRNKLVDYVEQKNKKPGGK